VFDEYTAKFPVASFCPTFGTACVERLSELMFVSLDDARSLPFLEAVADMWACTMARTTISPGRIML